LPNVVFEVKPPKPKQSQEESEKVKPRTIEAGSPTAANEIDSQMQSA
jgi:hypothetical protein